MIGDFLTCAVCQSELVEEFRAELMLSNTYGKPSETIERVTGYHICPKCRIVYKEES